MRNLVQKIKAICFHFIHVLIWFCMSRTDQQAVMVVSDHLSLTGKSSAQGKA